MRRSTQGKWAGRKFSPEIEELYERHNGPKHVKPQPWKSPDAVDSWTGLPGRDLGFSGISPDMKLGGLAGGEMMPDGRYMGSDGYIHQAILGSMDNGSMRSAGLL